MKRKLVMLLTLALTVAFVGGCGKGSQTETSNEVANSDTKQESSNGKVETLSEYLSTEKTIAYVVSEMDKAKTPEDIYFFEKGKLTIIPGEEFGMTLGDFSQMEDKDIWEKYEAVRETYKEVYAQEREERLIWCAVEICNDGYKRADDSAFRDYNAYDNNELDKVCSQMTREEYEEIKKTKEGLSCKGPFYDIPFSFAIETDSTGNSVACEKIVYPTSEDNPIEAPKRTYKSLTFSNAEGGNIQIYDINYNCFALEGGNTFCTRDSMKLDNIDSKNVLIDQSEDALNELYKAEVEGRY